MINHLQISHLRNLSHVHLPLTQCNLFIGANGSGKTSILESLFLLSRGKSFRTYQPKRYITHQHSHCTIFARLEDGSRLGIAKYSDASTVLKFNGQNLTAQSQLTARLPTSLIDPASMDILEQGSNLRRQLLDWLAFHVEPDFYPQWLLHQRLLKQRNSLLKQLHRINDHNYQQLQAWDKALAEHAYRIHQYRQQVFTAWQPSFKKMLALLLPEYAQQIELSYQAGFDIDIPLQQTLYERLKSDIKLGYTRVGSHRADIQVSWRESDMDWQADWDMDDSDNNGDFEQLNAHHFTSGYKTSATNVLSRGEKKLLITSLKLSQLPLLPVNQPFTGSDILTNKPIILLDDITSELDKKATEILLATLAKIPCQLFITSLTQEITPIIQEYWQNFSLFHVKQGEVKKQD